MRYLGIRCGSNEYAYVILSGTKSSPNIEVKNLIKFPQKYTKPERLKWFLQELEEIGKVSKNIQTIVIKTPEPLARKSEAYNNRIQNEAMVHLFAANCGIVTVHEKKKQTIAKDLGLKGKSNYLVTKLDHSIFPDYEKDKPLLQEAILAAWSSIK